MQLTSKQRAFLMGQANALNPIFQIGKESISPEMVDGIAQALEKRELIKIGVLKNCEDAPEEIAQIIAERTHSTVVKVIGKKIILYKCNPKKNKIELPK